MPEPSLGSSAAQNSLSWFTFLIISNVLEFHCLGSHKLQSFIYLLALFLASSKHCISHCDAQDKAWKACKPQHGQTPPARSCYKLDNVTSKCLSIIWGHAESRSKTVKAPLDSTGCEEYVKLFFTVNWVGRNG